MLIPVTNQFAVGAAGAVVPDPVVPSYQTVYENSTDGTSFTFSVTVASADDVLVFVPTGEGATAGSLMSISSVTLDGTGLTSQVYAAGTHACPIGIYTTSGVSAGTYDLVVTFTDQTALRCAVGHWRLAGTTATASDTASDISYGGTGLSVDVDIPANGLALFGYVNGNTMAITVGGATADYNQSTVGGEATGIAGGVSSVVASTRNAHTISTSHTNSAQQLGLVVAVFAGVA